MNSDEMNLARYIREQSEELQKLSSVARLDLLVHIFGVAALEATKHESTIPAPTFPQFEKMRPRVVAGEEDALRRRAALQEVLESLVDVAVNRSEGKARAAFYIANEVGTGLHHIAGMSPEYGAYTDNFMISNRSLACGLAAAIRRPVITNDVTQDPTWTKWKWLAKAFNYRGCWSFPIESRGGVLHGTFSIYLEDPAQANEQDIQFASMMTDAAAQIIGRHGRNALTGVGS